MPTDLPDAARMKVYLRVLTLAGRTLRIVSLRPSERARFSTNYFHDTWHVVSDDCGAAVLGRLLWGLSYQKQPGTLVLLHEPHLVPTPFDGARSLPLVIVPADLTSADEDAFRELKRRLGRLPAPTQTIRWHTFGLDGEMAKWDAERERPLSEWQPPEWTPTSHGERLWNSEQMRLHGGMICYSAPALVLRQQAAIVSNLRTTSEYRTTHHYLADGEHARSYADGEVQLFHDYRDRVSAATQARREVLALPNVPADPETLETVVSARRDQIAYRLRRARRRFTTTAPPPHHPSST